MRRPKPQPKDTRVPRLRDATPAHRGNAASHEHRARGQSTPRVPGRSNLRLRHVRSD